MSGAYLSGGGLSGLLRPPLPPPQRAVTWACLVLTHTAHCSRFPHSHLPPRATPPASARAPVTFAAWEMRFWPWNPLLFRITNRAREPENHILTPALLLSTCKTLGVNLTSFPSPEDSHLCSLLLRHHHGSQEKVTVQQFLGLEWGAGEQVCLCAQRLEPRPCSDGGGGPESHVCMHCLA